MCLLRECVKMYDRKWAPRTTVLAMKWLLSEVCVCDWFIVRWSKVLPGQGFLFLFQFFRLRTHTHAALMRM